ncbi:beta-galactosidase [Iodobacter sp.]|uniref:GH39 family glycosyl hydrolase n=1 Tax=Iodobacter sp. TaxID=1915058 RepID=UPI0025EE174E|nr:beta-galactosidase [Iodobacter sp.]
MRYLIFYVTGIFLLLSTYAWGGSVSKDYFGMHVHRSNQNKLWLNSGLGSIRLHDANVTWLDLQPSPDSWKWAWLDGMVNRATAANVSILLPLQGTPAWASRTPELKAAYGYGANAMPSNLAAWENYVEAVVSRYRGKIAAYEIWNESNLSHFFSGNPEDLALLTKSAVKIIRQIDPEAKVVCPSGVGDYGIKWFKRLLATEVMSDCDVISYHFYTKHQPPESMLPIIDDIKIAIRAAGYQRKPLWNTETGWLIDTPEGVDPVLAGFKADAKKLNDFESVSYLLRSFILGAGADLGRFYWYSWDHPSMGITKGRGTGWRPAAIAFKNLTVILDGGVVEPCRLSADQWVCNGSLKDGRKGFWVWSTKSTMKNFSGIYNVLQFQSDGGLILQHRVKKAVPIGTLPSFLYKSS